MGGGLRERRDVKVEVFEVAFPRALTPVTREACRPPRARAGMSRSERASREPREPRAREPPARRAPARPKMRSVDDFSDEALLAELGDEGPAVSSDGETFESLEVLERRLRRELASMPDACDEEEALRREIETADDEPDEATALYLSLMQDERSVRARRRAEREAVADSIARSVAADTAASVEAMRAEAHAEKMEAVRLNRAGDKEGARAALRRATATQARADDAERSEMLNTKTTPTEPSVSMSSRESSEALARRAQAFRLEAVRLNRAGDREGARALLRRAKETRARADDAEPNPSKTPEYGDAVPSDDGALDGALDPRASAHLEALMASARAEMMRVASEDPDAFLNEERGGGSPEGDARLLSDALGADHDDAHFSGAYDGLAADGTLRDVDAGALALERCAELEEEILEMKKRALAAKRAGETDAARDFLKKAKALLEELRETRAFAEDEAGE